MVTDRQQVEQDAERFETAFHKTHPLLWWLTLLGPVAVSAVLLFVVYQVSGGATVRRLLTTAAATFFFFGKFVILGGDGQNGGEAQTFFTPAQLALLVVYLDLIVAVLLVPHSHVLFKLPWIGPRLSALVDEGIVMLRSKRWLRRATFLGIAGFVMFPLAATGSVGASILGRLLGMSRGATIAAIALGSVLGCSLMYFGAGLINRYLDRDSPVVAIGGIVAISLFIIWLTYRYRRWCTAAR